MLEQRSDEITKEMISMGRSPGEFTKGETFHDGIEVVYTAVEMGYGTAFYLATLLWMGV